MILQKVGVEMKIGLKLKCSGILKATDDITFILKYYSKHNRMRKIR